MSKHLTHRSCFIAFPCKKENDAVNFQRGMRFFRQRITPAENIAFIAMIVAFDAILSLVSVLLPFAAIFIMLVAPLGGAAVSLFCKKRYIAVYLIAAIGICLAVTAWELMTVLFYMIPTLICGAAYGLLWKLNAPISVNVFAITLLSVLFFYLSILLIRGLLGVDMIEFLLSLIKRNNDDYSRDIFPLFILGYSFAQAGIMHGFLSYELSRIGWEPKAEDNLQKWVYLAAGLFIISSFICGFFLAKTAYFLLGLALYWTLCSIRSFMPRVYPLVIALLVFGAFGSILLFAAVYSSMPANSGLLLVNVPLLWAVGCAALNFFCTRAENRPQ